MTHLRFNRPPARDRAVWACVLVLLIAAFPAFSQSDASADEAVPEHVVRRAAHQADIEAALRVVETGDVAGLDFRFADYHLALLNAAELENLQQITEEHGRSRTVAGGSRVTRDNLALIDVFLSAYDDYNSGDYATVGTIPPGGYIRGGPPVASGYTRRFEFADGYLSFFSNEMDGVTRMVGYTGGRRIQGPFLVVDLWEITTLTGGRFEPGGFASVGTDWVLTEARFETTIVPEDAGYFLRFPISPVETRAMYGSDIPFVTIAGLPYGRVYE